MFECPSFFIEHSINVEHHADAFLRTEMSSGLDRLIAPDIKNDALYWAIYNLVRTEPLSTILEIGSSSGEGSTEAFVAGISENPSEPTLFCMELSKARFDALKYRYQHLPFVKCYNVSSVPLESFPSKSEIMSFYNHTNTNLRTYSLAEVLGWLEQDVDYLKNASVSQNGIELIKSENNIEYFDLVLIDGSEFTGSAELEHIYGAKYIVLDDINAYKNYYNWKRLLNDPNYELVEENRYLRNGYAIFKKK